MSDLFRPIEWTVGQGSGLSPLRRGPFGFSGVAVSLTLATVSVLVVDEAGTVIVAWGSVDGVATGDATGYAEWEVLASLLTDPGKYRVWWQVDHPDYTQPYLTPRPDVLIVTAIP